MIIFQSLSDAPERMKDAPKQQKWHKYFTVCLISVASLVEIPSMVFELCSGNEVSKKMS